MFLDSSLLFLFFRSHEVLQFGHETFQIGKFAVDRGKADISHFVDRAQFTEDHFPYFLAGHFLGQGIADIAFDLGDDVFQLLPLDFPLVAGPEQAVQLSH